MEILKVLGVAILASLAVASLGAFGVNAALDALEKWRLRLVERHKLRIAG